jgi:hypothetical protein
MKIRSLTIVPALVLLSCAVGAPAQSTPQYDDVRHSQPPDKRLMSDADFKIFMLRVEAVLPIWEAQVRSIDLEKYPQISYARGKSITDKRNLELMEISNVRLYLARLQAKRTVSGELALSGFMQALYDFGEEIVWEEAVSGLALTSLEKYEPQLSELIMRIGNDVNARVALLEKGTCP